MNAQQNPLPRTIVSVALWSLFAVALGHGASTAGGQTAGGPTRSDAPPRQGLGNATMNGPLPMQIIPPRGAAEQPLPAPFELTPAAQKRLGDLLSYWEAQSSKVRTFRCRFELRKIDTVFGPPQDPISVSRGIIRYAAPDKGIFKVEEVGEYTLPAEQGQQPTYPMKPAESATHWVCDGDSVFEFNSAQKQLIERRLPPELQGQHIADGPLPFIFGSTRAKIEARYWIRELNPPAGQRGYWFEAHPKRREDAGNFKLVWVILDEKTFLPNALQVFPPTYDAKTNASREVYLFSDRQVNHAIDLSRDFMNQFISPQKPRGWKKVVEDFHAVDSRVPQAAQRTGVPPRK